MRRKTILVGMNNPLSDDPRLALWPDPPGCAGYRLWKMMQRRTGASKGDYIRSFSRVNLVVGEWNRHDARAAAEDMYVQYRGCRLVLLGSAVRIAFRLPPVLVRPVEHRGVTFRQLPHPSGRCRWYNDPRHRTVAGMLLEEEARR